MSRSQMLQCRVSAGSAALLLSGLTVFAVQAPAYAQTAADCTGVLPTASPPLTTTGSLTDTTVAPGQAVSAITGVGLFTPGSTVEYGVQPPVAVLGTVVAAPDGSASANFTVPSLPDGTYAVFFRSAAVGVTPVDDSVCVLPFTSTQPAAVLPIATTKPAPQPAAPRPAARPAALPFTGSDAFIPLTLGGVALVAVGAGIVVVTRKRRRTEVTPTSLA